MCYVCCNKTEEVQEFFIGEKVKLKESICFQENNIVIGKDTCAKVLKIKGNKIGINIKNFLFYVPSEKLIRFSENFYMS